MVRSEEINGLHIAYERAGDGPSLVLLHGFIQDSRYWRPQIKDLSRDFTVIAWDTPGCGQSSDPPKDFTLADYADCLADFLASLGTGEMHIVGLSWGGTLAQCFYWRDRRNGRSLGLAATDAGWKGSLTEEMVQERIARCRRDSELPADEWVPD